jgi:hypothetical protein
MDGSPVHEPTIVALVEAAAAYLPQWARHPHALTDWLPLLQHERASVRRAAALAIACLPGARRALLASMASEEAVIDTG